MTFTSALGRGDRKEISELFSPLEMVFIISLSIEKSMFNFILRHNLICLIAVKKVEDKRK